MDDPLDVSLHDPELLAEVELMTDLIIAASESQGVLTQSAIDRLLGLDPTPWASQKASTLTGETQANSGK